MCDQQSLRPACAYVQSDRSLCLSLENSISVKLLNEHHLEVLSLKGGCTGSSESSLVKMPYCWKSHVAAHLSCLKHSDVEWILLVKVNSTPVNVYVELVVFTRIAGTS